MIATLCFFIKDENGNRKILLGKKKRGFGVNKWNGFGGKVIDGEDIRAAACREIFEEIGILVKPENLKKVAELEFYFHEKEEWNQVVHVFFVSHWEGEPIESEEMKPSWFDVSNIPYSEMWVDDKYWLPSVLEGKFVSAKFLFRDQETLLNYEVKEKMKKKK